MGVLGAHIVAGKGPFSTANYQFACQAFVEGEGGILREEVFIYDTIRVAEGNSSFFPG